MRAILCTFQKSRGSPRFIPPVFLCMEKSCSQCKVAFTPEPEDKKFCDQMGVPAPSQCPRCRLQRRLCERNTRNLYYRKCDKTGKQIVSQYHQNQPFPVYAQEVWMSDDWDPLSYGRDIDFTKPFFPQMKALFNAVPHMALFNTPGTMENSEFNNCTAYLKNCYLICESDFAEDCYYSNLLKKCKNTVDSSVCYDDELCYECIDCIGCQRLQYSQDCQNCSDSYFLKNCQSCRDCIGCMNQRQKQYMICNAQYTKDQYEKFKKDFRLNTASGVAAIRKKAQEFFLQQPHKAMHGEKNDNVVGNYINNGKNVYRSFDMKDCEDCRHCARLSLNNKSCMDYNSWGDNSELVYSTSSCGDHCYFVRFCSNCINTQHTDHCVECFNSSNLFGCIGLRKKQYCILNKQYTKEEYEALVPKLIAHMEKGGEWGEYMPMDMSRFAYNEAFVMDQFPLTKEEVIKRGWRWYEQEEKEQYLGEDVALPETIGEVDDSVCKRILRCAVTRKPYKIIPQELKFYRLLDIPLPRTCPDRRHQERQTKRNPYQLWERQCGKCKQAIQTTYAPERPEIVYCQDCYLKTVY